MWDIVLSLEGDYMKSQSSTFNNIYIDSTGIIVGKLEKEGPLKRYFKNYIDDSYFGEKTFEMSQVKLANTSIKLALKKSKYEDKNIDIAFGGDLSNQIFNTTYALREYNFPYIGVYAACASSVLSYILAGIYIEQKAASSALCVTSSHIGVAEKQFRYPNEYGIQRCETSTSTITGACSIIVSSSPNKVKFTNFTIGRIIDCESKNVNDMGTCMSFAAIDTFKVHMENFSKNENDYDLILTGDLSLYGSKIFQDELLNCGFDINSKYEDCGLLIYDRQTQNINAGGSGPACLPCVAFSYGLNKLINGECKKILLIATGALHSQVSYQQKQTIPCIAHAIEMEVA